MPLDTIRDERLRTILSTERLEEHLRNAERFLALAEERIGRPE